MVREMVMARLFGAGPAYDAFLLGMRIPNLVRNLFAEGALSSAFVPVFSQTLARGGKQQAAALSDSVATALMLTVGTLCVCGMIFSPWLVSLLAPGFAQVPGKFELAVLLTRIMFPFLLLVALAAQAMGLLNACGRFGVPAMASTFFNLGSLTAGLALGFTLGRQMGHGLIVSMAVGVVAGGVLQLGWQLPALRRLGFGFHFRIGWQDPALRRILRLTLPAFLGTAALQINVIVNTNLASSLTDASGAVVSGPVSWLSYAFRFLQFPVGVFGAAIATATLPEISRSAAAERIGEFCESLVRSVGTALLLTIPSSVGLAILGRSIIATVFEGGHFQRFDTGQTAAALACYSVGLAGYAVTKILAPAFYALDDGRTPVLVSVASVGVNLAGALALLRWAGLGHRGLALSTALVALFGAAALFLLLRRRLAGLRRTGLARAALRICAASAVMGAALVVFSGAIHRWAGGGRPAAALDVAVCVPLGAAVFYICARALRVPELEALRTACYTAIRNASRPEVGHPPARDR
jgi:putative peptidoglycan lipid II flippase